MNFVADIILSSEHLNASQAKFWGACLLEDLECSNNSITVQLLLLLNLLGFIVVAPVQCWYCLTISDKQISS